MKNNNSSGGKRVSSSVPNVDAGAAPNYLVSTSQQEPRSSEHDPNSSSITPKKIKKPKSRRFVREQAFKTSDDVRFTLQQKVSQKILQSRLAPGMAQYQPYPAFNNRSMVGYSGAVVSPTRDPVMNAAWQMTSPVMSQAPQPGQLQPTLTPISSSSNSQSQQNMIFGYPFASLMSPSLFGQMPFSTVSTTPSPDSGSAPGSKTLSSTSTSSNKPSPGQSTLGTVGMNHNFPFFGYGPQSAGLMSPQSVFTSRDISANEDPLAKGLMSPVNGYFGLMSPMNGDWSFANAYWPNTGSQTDAKQKAAK